MIQIVCPAVAQQIICLTPNAIPGTCAQICDLENSICQTPDAAVIAYG